MKQILTPVLFVLLAAPLLAGDIHGKVACKGVRDSSDAVVSIAAIPGKTFPVQVRQEMAQVWVNLVTAVGQQDQQWGGSTAPGQVMEKFQAALITPM